MNIWLLIQRLNLYKSLSLSSFGLTNVGLSELNHLWYSLSRKNRQKVCNKNEPVLLTVSGTSTRLDSAQCDAFSLVRAASSSVDEGRVEAVHVEMLIIDEETLAHGSVAVLIRLDVEFDLVVLQLALVWSEDSSLVGEDSWAVPVFFGLQFLD